MIPAPIETWTIVKSPQTFGGQGQVHGPDTDPVQVVSLAALQAERERVQRIRDERDYAHEAADNLVRTLEAEREARERAERERDELRRLAVKSESALREVIDDRDSAERRLDEAVKALREIAGQEKIPDSYRRPGAWEIARHALASIEATGADADQPTTEPQAEQ